VRLEGLGQLKNKIQWPHRDLIPRPSGLYHNKSNNYATACPQIPLERVVNSLFQYLHNDKVRFHFTPVELVWSFRINIKMYLLKYVMIVEQKAGGELSCQIRKDQL
jgi:hypothetical protein